MDIDHQEFTNHQVDIESIPSVATIEYSPLERNLLKSSVVGNILFFGIVLIVLTLLVFVFKIEFFEENHIYFWGGVGLVSLLSVLYAFSAFNKKSYAIRERDIIYNSGLFWKSSKVIPFNRVQHCEVSVGPVDRLYGIAELKIFTAGGATSDLSIEGLSPETANRIKDFIVKKTGLDEEE